MVRRCPAVVSATFLAALAEVKDILNTPRLSVPTAETHVEVAPIVILTRVAADAI